MRTFVLFAAIVCSGLVLGCQDKELNPEVMAAYERFVQALQADDREALYAQSPTAFHARMDALYLRWKAIVARVRDEYPQSERSKTLERLGASSIDKASGGQDLFIELLETPSSPPSAEQSQGLAVADLTVRDGRAIVTTKAGDVFEFVTDQDEWRCTLLSNQFIGSTYGSLKLLESNIDTVEENLDSWRVASRDTTDQTRPEGALNTIVQAAIHGKRMTVYALLSDATHQMLTAGAKKADDLRKHVKSSLPSGEPQREFLVKHGLEWIGRVAAGRSLFAILWDTGRFKSVFPLTRVSKIQSVLPGQNGEAVVLIRTQEKESRYTMVVNKDGKWKLKNLEAVVRDKAIKPVGLALDALKSLNAPAETAP